MRFLTLLLTAYFFLLGLLPQLDGSQLARIGQLWEHFGEHRVEVTQAGEELRFWDFIYEHYLAADKHDHPDRSQHDQLPFQHLGASTLITLAMVTVVPNEGAMVLETRPVLGYRNVFFPVEFIASIPHPPSRG